MPTLYISDLDGTLLNNAGTLSHFSENALKGMIADGLLFTVASARSVVAIQQMMRGVTLPLHVIEFNGAFISDLGTGYHEVVNNIEPSIAEDIFSRLCGLRCSPFVSTFTGQEDRVYYGRVVNEGMQWYVDDRLAKKDKRWMHDGTLDLALRDQVVCFTLIGEQQQLVDIQSEILAHHGGNIQTHLIENQYSCGWHWLTVHDRRASKDDAIRILREMHDLEGHELVAFGDQINDINMLRVADHGVAVANASPDLKVHASQVIGTNEDDSVVRYIQARRSKEVQA